MWHMLGKINAYSVLVGKTERDHLGDLNVDGRIILKLR
jgi:hypothetical protein